MTTRKGSDARCASSFRDPSGFLFYSEGRLYRQVNQVYQGDYDLLIGSGLYDDLIKADLLIPHVETHLSASPDGQAYKILHPEHVSFISYPFEWSFSELKHAGMVTLEIQKRGLKFGMSLKDASAYNIQFHKGRPIFIDTLSFEKYREGEPWVAYRQFCQHFLAPLALMAHTDVRLNQWFRISMDGLPLDLVSALLPFRTRFKFPLLTHIHLHARMQKHFSRKVVDVQKFKLSLRALFDLLEHLQNAIEGLSWKPRATEWTHYYECTSYAPEAFQEKKQVLASFLGFRNPRNVWDLGANTGVFGRIAADRGIDTVAFDTDPAAVEKNYLDCVANRETHMLPLILDLTNPSPAIGWNLEERMSLAERGPVDMVLALALIHHLVISNNVPLDHVAAFFSRLGQALVIEFIPKSDFQAQKLLATRKDVFADYGREVFETAFGRYFEVLRVVEIKNSQRVLYLMQNRKRL